MERLVSKLVLVVAVTVLAGHATESLGQEKFKETYEAFAVAMGTSNPPVLPSGVTATLQINVTRWTTDEERKELLDQLVENGPEALAESLSKQKETGWVRVLSPGRGASPFPSERLRYAREFEVNGTRRVVLALDRYISLWEGARRPRWRDFDVTLLVLDLDDEGKGSGQLAMGVRVDFDPERRGLTIENFGTEPVRLNNVRKR